MKPFRASLGIVVLGVGVVAACGSNSPGEVIVEPGITAIRESNALACSSDLRTLQQAVEAYTTLNIDPPTAESDLVPDWLRAESEHYDLVDGQVVPAPASDCPAAPGDAVQLSPQTPSSTPATAGALAAQAGECAQQRKVLEVAIAAYLAATGSPPATEADLVPNYIGSESTHYDIVDGAITIAPGSACT